MLITFGKHDGKMTAKVLLREPNWAVWAMTKKDATGALASVKKELFEDMLRFDAVAFKVECQGNGCSKTATRVSLYRDDVRPNYWCDDCDPYQLGAPPGELNIVQRYAEALKHIEDYCSAPKTAFRGLVKALAQAKGLW